VAIIYFDSSALVKLLISEEGSELVEELWDGCDAAVSSRLAYPEVCAALAAAERRELFSRKEISLAASTWELYWEAMRIIELNSEVAKNAGAIARSLVLRGADSVHLASALAVGLDNLIVAVWDRQLHAASIAAGLRVTPAEIGV
jgi:predicted nucleic acid-binding protein